MQIDSFFSFGNTLSIGFIEFVSIAIIRVGKELMKMLGRVVMSLV